ncbi:MAG: NAD(P)-dependent oxidoreductase [Hydrogenophilus sp.]|nr:NAD(P)-dependent oxidoreductase [Hydrogenophilus sp.]
MPPSPALLLYGGTSLVGRALLRTPSFVARFSSITILTRDPAGFQNRFSHLLDPTSVRLCRADLTDPLTLPTLTADTAIIALTVPPSTPPLERYQTILTITTNALAHASRSGIRHLLYLSSGAVYGPYPRPIAEEDPLNLDPLDPTHHYGLAKLAGEHLAALYRSQGGYRLIVARLFSFSGPDFVERRDYLLSDLIHQALFEPALALRSDPNLTRSYLDQEDLARALLLLLERGKDGSVYNIGAPDPYTAQQLAEHVQRILAPQKPIIHLNSSTPPTRLCYLPDTRRATALGFSPAIPLERSIQRAARALLRSSPAPAEP